MTMQTAQRGSSTSKPRTSLGMWAAVVLPWAASIAILGLTCWVQWQMAHHYGSDETPVWLIFSVILAVPVTGSMLLTVRAVLGRRPRRWTIAAIALISLLLVLAALKTATGLGLSQ